jgi:hypothetical protein
LTVWEIGIVIRNRQFRTVAVDYCVSVCAFMWLAGVQRAAFSDAEIGFHGAYNGDTKNTSSSGNAVAGAYLARLGFSYRLIAEMTEAQPNEMKWLDFAKAKSVGIPMTVLPTQRKKQSLHKRNGAPAAHPVRATFHVSEAET